MKKSTKTTLIALAFLLPNLLGFMVFTFGPVVFSMGASFTNWDLQGREPTRFIGLDNFVNILTDNQFWLFFVNTIFFMLAMPIAIAGSLAVALLLNSKIRGLDAYRTLLYLPSVTAGVATMLLWKALYNPDFGPINFIIEGFFDWIGMDSVTGPKWLLSTQNLLALGVEQVSIVAAQFGLGAREAIIIMGVWGSFGGGNMILYLAALGNVPQELTEAAELDGAGRWKLFRNVTWPQLAPTTFFIVVMGVIGGMQGGFEQARVMTQGGPAGTTTTLAYYIYNKAFTEYQLGFASAISLILFVMILTFTIINWKFGNKEVNY
ncbi:MAG: sugar ABC transporter permease [Fimbriimonadaceae bacterium]|nr:sugar ABC transporter permease [Fimbriimonadaceae bacterium]